MTKNLKFLSMFLVSFNFSFFHLLSHILVQVQNEGFHHQSHSSPPQKLFSLRSFLQLQFSLSPPRIWSERAPCWFLHQYRVLSRNCKQESLRANARQISDKMLTQVFWKWKTFLNRTIRKILSSPMKLWSRYRVSELEERIISEGSFVNANIYWHLKNMEELNIERWIRIWKTFPPVCKIQYFSSTIDLKESVKCVLSKVLCRGSLRRRWGFTEREHIQKTFLFPCCWMNILPFLKVFFSSSNIGIYWPW